MLNPQYVHLKPTSSPQSVAVMAPFAVVVVIDAMVLPEWRQMVSEWLIEKGCLYMMAWGHDCSLWDDSVDWANLKPYEKFSDMPDDKNVVTTWHDNESLEEVFYFAITCALPFSPLIKNIIVLDITDKSREHDMLTRYKNVQDELGEDEIIYYSETPDNSKKVAAAKLGSIFCVLLIPVLWFFLFR